MGRLATDPTKFRVLRIKKKCKNPDCDVIMELPYCKRNRQFHNKSCKTSYQGYYNEKWIKAAAENRKKGSIRPVELEEILKRTPIQIYEAGYKRGYAAGRKYTEKWSK